MKKIKTIALLIALLTAYNCVAQNSYKLSVGRSIPDNISNKYLKSGIYFAYGIDFSLSERFKISTDLSVFYNGGNPDYRSGFFEDPYFVRHPEDIEFYEMLNEDIGMSTDYEVSQLTTSASVNLKYILLPSKISPYFQVGVSGSYLFYSDPIETIDVNENDEVRAWGLGGSGTYRKHSFTLGLNTGVGVQYTFKNLKSIFAEGTYLLLPNQHFGRNQERFGTFILRAGISFPFRRG